MSLYRIIERWAQTQPDKTALHFQGEDISYAALAQRMVRISESLAERLGVARRRSRRLSRSTTVPRCWCCCSRWLASAHAAAAQLPPGTRRAADHSRTRRAEGAHRRRGVSQGRTTAAFRVPGTADGGHRAQWPKASSRGMRRSLRRRHLSHRCGEAQDPVLLVYTSGTTGRPKGAVHTQEGLIWNAINAVALPRPDQRGPCPDRAADVPCRRSVHPDRACAACGSHGDAA